MGENSKGDLGYVFLPNSISEFLKELSVIDDFSLKLSKLKVFIHLHEEELRKVYAFKRELPICMRLLKDVIERLREEAEQCEAREMGSVMEEFLPLKKSHNCDGDGGSKRSSDIIDKKEWMSSAQLWSTPVHYEHFDLNSKRSFLHDLKPREKGDCSGSRENMFQPSVNRGGAFVPYKHSDYPAKIETEIVTYDVLTLSMPVKEMGSIDLSLERNVGGNNRHSASGNKSQNKKQRRCWSSELHKRFVNALQQLGGPQAATPKQIREIMQEDGLTNDEVKSHLQKYRIHIRKLPSTSTAPPPSCKWLLLTSQSGDCSTSSIAQTASPQGPLHLGGSARPASTACADSAEEEEEEKSEIHSSKSRLSHRG